MPKFAANLTMLFNEVDFLERFAAAARAGFQAVEYLFPYAYPKDQLAALLTGHGFVQVLHNLPPGDWAAGRIVFANLSVEEPPVRADDEPLVRAYGSWTGQISANRESLSFRPFGQAGVTATIVFCDVRGPRSARALIISQAGRPRIADTRSSGEPLACD